MLDDARSAGSADPSQDAEEQLRGQIFACELVLNRNVEYGAVPLVRGAAAAPPTRLPRSSLRATAATPSTSPANPLTIAPPLPPSATPPPPPSLCTSPHLPAAAPARVIATLVAHR